MRKMTLIAAMAVMLLDPMQAFAAARLQLYPTRITIKDGDRSSSISVVNGGTATGRYRAELVDMAMPFDGGLERLEDRTMPFSAKPYIRISPRSVTVPPGQSQKFRLLVRMPRDVESGEYRTHLHVLMSSENVERDQKKVEDDRGFGVAMRPRFRVSVPIIVFRGESTFTADIESVQFVAATAERPKPRVLIDLLNEGTRSALGDLVVTLEKNGQTHEVYRANEFTIYRGTPKRRLEAALELPGGIAPDGGKLTVTYSRLKRDGGELLGKKELQL